MSIINLKDRYRKTFRRKLIESGLRRLIKKKVFKGFVLDIGGGNKRENICNLKNCPDALFFVGDINPKPKDLFIDVQDMSIIGDNTFDVVKATELFEHVRKPEKGIKECYRILENNGTFIMTMPFMFPEHGDPEDFQRWTKSKIERVLVNTGFKYYRIIPMGYYFTVLADMLFILFRSNIFTKVFIPLLPLLVNLDKLIKSKKLKSYTTGYFVVARK